MIADKWNAIQVAPTAFHYSEIPSENRLMAPIKSSDKPESKIDRATRLLRENPDWKKRTVMSLEETSDIDHNTWAKAKKRAGG